MAATTMSADRRLTLNRRSLRLAYATAGYNLLEGVVAVTAGAAASSTALLGFGLDSFVEVSSALVVIWQFRSRVPEARERLALRGIAVSFLALAAWISFDAVTALAGGERPDASPAEHRHRRRVRGRHAAAGLRETAHRPRTRLGDRRGRQHADDVVHLPVGDRAGSACC
nr:hypothetical protein GCM10020092_084050 [Actinoplanes digitatis]